MDCKVGLAGCAGLASLAKKNFESAGVALGLRLSSPTSDPAVLKETVGRFGISLSIPDMPNPGPCIVASWAPRNESFVDESTGVPVGVPVGVELALPPSTRTFLDPDLGVILLLRKEARGVGGSSFEDSGV